MVMIDDIFHLELGPHHICVEVVNY